MAALKRWADVDIVRTAPGTRNEEPTSHEARGTRHGYEFLRPYWFSNGMLEVGGGAGIVLRNA
jgi:hypothetical protein